VTAVQTDLAHDYLGLDELLSADEIHTLVSGRAITGSAAFGGAS
jgi:hypothetical protein